MTLEMNLADIQGLIFSGYGHLDHSGHVFISFGDPEKARAWLARLLPRTTTAKWDVREGKTVKPGHTLNIAFTAAGLMALGLPEACVRTLSQEAREGIVGTTRSRKLGDNGSSDPDKWDFGGPFNPSIHALLIVYASSAVEIRTLLSEIEAGMGPEKVSHVHSELGCRLPDEREHFGFKDGLSQPAIEGDPRKPADEQAPIQTGEFILGYANSYGHLPPTPTVPADLDRSNCLLPLIGAPGEPTRHDFGRNGSYLVFRKLHQDVAGFRAFFVERFQDPRERDLMKAKFVGRWPNGTPLTLSPDGEDSSLGKLPKANDFGYAAMDARGYGCPIGAHIRRTNPRDALTDDPAASLVSVNRHRLLRRGMPYGPLLPAGDAKDDGKPRGLLFLCINADIKRQFEFVQQTWVENPKFGGLYNDRDPLIGDNLESGEADGEPRNMTVQRVPVRKRILDIPRFVTVKGGGYFFMPSLSALRFLTTLESMPSPGKSRDSSGIRVGDDSDTAAASA